MMYNREGGFGEKVRSYYLPGNTPAPPQEHRAYGSTSNAAEELINLTHLLFSACGGGAPPVVEEGYLGVTGEKVGRLQRWTLVHLGTPPPPPAAHHPRGLKITNGSN